jgi:uncharacterized membrane protein
MHLVSLGRDTKGRTLAKTIVYRMVAIAFLAALSYYLTGDAGEATTITILFNVGGTGAYYALERLWEYVEWGRSPVDTMPLPRHSDARAFEYKPSGKNSDGLASAAETGHIDDVEGIE